MPFNVISYYECTLHIVKYNNFTRIYDNALWLSTLASSFVSLVLCLYAMPIPITRSPKHTTMQTLQLLH